MLYTPTPAPMPWLRVIYALGTDLSRYKAGLEQQAPVQAVNPLLRVIQDHIMVRGDSWSPQGLGWVLLVFYTATVRYALLACEGKSVSGPLCQDSV
jgi:hypothetical protein